MKIKFLAWALVISVILIIVLAVIAFLKPDPKVINVKIPAQEITAVFDKIDKVQKILDKLKFPISYIIIEGKDTTVVDSNTLYKNVPVVATTWDSSFTISINKQIYPIDYYQKVIAKGEVFEVTFGLYQAEFTVEMEQPSLFRFYGNIGVGYCNNNCIPVMAELGIMAKKRYSLSGILLRTDKTYYGAMFRIWF